MSFIDFFLFARYNAASKLRAPIFNSHISTFQRGGILNFICPHRPATMAKVGAQL